MPTRKSFLSPLSWLLVILLAGFAVQAQNVAGHSSDGHHATASIPFHATSHSAFHAKEDQAAVHPETDSDFHIAPERLDRETAPLGQEAGALDFVENKGQWPSAVRYAAEVQGGRVFIEGDGLR